MSALTATLVGPHDTLMNESTRPVRNSGPELVASNGGRSRVVVSATPQGGITLTGVLDTFCSDDARTRLSDAVGRAVTPVIDVSGLEFVDVAGMRAVAAAAQTLADRHDGARIDGASTHFRKVWCLLGYDSIDGVRLAG